MSRPHVLIAGAGIGGLAAALALLKSGFDIDVYEQAPALTEVGAGVQLSANGTRALDALGVGAALQSLSCEAAGKEVRLWNSGQTWKLFDLGSASVERYGFPYLTVYRPDLIDVLAQALRGAKAGAIHLGARCVGFEASGGQVELRFADGATARGDALIGADGVHSVIRRQLFGGDTPVYTGLMAWRGAIPMQRLPAHMRRIVGTNWIGPGRHVVHYPMRGGTLMNFVGVVERADWTVESWSARGALEELAADFAGWHADVHAMIRGIDTPYKWALLGREPLPLWGSGRVTLLGDACHPTLPFLAQGAVMAIEDGVYLARALARHAPDVALAFARYEAGRRGRAGRMVAGSAENAQRFHDRRLADSAQAERYVAAEWSEARVRERYDWLFEYDVTRAPV